MDEATLKKLGMLIEALKQPSTIKGLIGLIGLVGWSVAPGQYQSAIEGLAVIYFLIAIFWQKS